MVCGQIHAPAYLSNYVRMHVLDRKFRELSEINLFNKKQFVGKESDSSQDALKLLYFPYCILENIWF
jgi:hypothetical protein